MAQCINCGKEVPESSKVCEECEKNIKPGSWRKTDYVPPRQPEQRERRPLDAQVHADLVESYQLFQKSLGVHPKVVYYPCSAYDASPTAAFPDSRVVFAEKDKASIGALQAKGNEVHETDANTFELDQPADVVILLNPALEPEGPLKNLREQGYVLCNDYHKTATKLKENKDYELVAMIRKHEGKEQIFDTVDFDLYWQTVDSDEELQRISPSMYDMAKRDVQLYLNTDKDIVANYRALYSKFYGKDLGVAFDHAQGRVFLSLPSKKGTIDDFFVYRRKQTATETVQ